MTPRYALPRPARADLKPKRRNKAPEADFQKTVAAYLRLALPRQSGIFWSCTLNGQRIATEAGRRKAKEQGLNAGVYDFVFVVLDVHDPLSDLIAGDTYWLELKAKTGTLTREQKALMEVLWPAGRGASARSLDQVAAALTAWGFPIRCHP